SHRGAGLLAPENTVEAFELAWSLGTVPEADLRMTRDGVIVAFHDGDFSRVAKNADASLKKKAAEDLTWEELSAVDVGDGLRAARMDVVFSRMKERPERTLYLDVKKVDLERLAAEVKAHGIQDRVVLASPRIAELRRWKELSPASGTLLWIGGSEEEQRRRIGELRTENFAGLTQIQIHVRLKKGADLAKPDPFMPSDDFLVALGKELRERKILFQVLPWGAADVKIYGRLLDLGVMSFATDYPKDTVAAVRAYLAGR
ncbi:MAG TPA: glycerophosphodiester phosphodiesterase family protein, partial [Planctomycetota bacterium]|nr:glycerophosphodiester phosphodiesterase family protein [Planctomycetota bacterium]